MPSSLSTIVWFDAYGLEMVDAGLKSAYLIIDAGCVCCKSADIEVGVFPPACCRIGI